MDLEIAKNIVFSTLEGKATTMQQKMVEEWLADPQNMELYFKWLEEWEKNNPQFLPDTEQAYQTFLAKTSLEKESKSFTLTKNNAPKKFTNRRLWLGIAASVALLFASVGIFFKDQIIYKEYKTAFAEVQNITLPDKSTVVLNANSSLKVPRFGFGTETREVFLQGEAEFSVTHTIDNKRFIVRTPDKLKVEVLGTEFVVYSRPRGTKVALHKGKVQLHQEESKQKPLEMKVGDVVTVDKKGTFQLQSTKNALANNSKAWKEHSFSFESTSLQEIAYQVEENFGVKVQISDYQLSKRQISGDYKAESAEELLKAIAEILGVEVSKNDELLIIN
jgi:ferric-dicitrate binding protein FerR (iron transport regulator)